MYNWRKFLHLAPICICIILILDYADKFWVTHDKLYEQYMNKTRWKRYLAIQHRQNINERHNENVGTGYLSPRLSNTNLSTGV